MRFTLCFLSLTLFTGCANIQPIQPLSQRVTAIVQGDTKQIFWLDERLNEPQKLTQIAILGDLGQYQSEYRWREGLLREIERKSELLIDGEIKKQTALIRYDKSGQANYQKYLVNDEIFPLKDPQLKRYFQEAQLAYETAVALLQNKTIFFQGYMQNGKILECNSQKPKTVTIRDPLFSDASANAEKRFLAAAGTNNFAKMTAQNVLLLENAEYLCIERPVFSDTSSNTTKN